MPILPLHILSIIHTQQKVLDFYFVALIDPDHQA